MHTDRPSLSRFTDDEGADQQTAFIPAAVRGVAFKLGTNSFRSLSWLANRADLLLWVHHSRARRVEIIDYLSPCDLDDLFSNSRSECICQSATWLTYQGTNWPNKDKCASKEWHIEWSKTHFENNEEGPTMMIKFWCRLIKLAHNPNQTTNLIAVAKVSQ